MFEILEHTADLGIRVRADSLPVLYVEAARALQEVALDPGRIEERQEYRLAASGEDHESLLVNWLNEIVWSLDGERVAFARIEITSFSSESITATAWGEPRDPERHEPRLVVKAATYHQLLLTQQDGRWVAEIFLDI